jgi:hypothetical protein
MSFSFASIKAALVHLFGVEEGKAHSLVEAVLADAAPVLSQLRADIAADAAKLAGEARTDAEALYGEALADLKAEIAAVRQLVTPAPVPQTAPDIAPAGPAAPAV